MRTIHAILSILLLCQLSAGQQTPPQIVSEPVARQHLIKIEAPIYPPIAKAARVQGNVVVRIEINATGAVTSGKVVSGPPMLQQAALDAVKTWRFTPFGSASGESETTAILTIPFQIDKPGEGPTAAQNKAAQALFPLEDKCRMALKAQDTPAAVSACNDALAMSFQAGDMTSSDRLGRLDAHQLYGRALLFAGRPTEALEQENLAIEEAKKCLSGTDEEYGMPFFWRALVEANLGQVNSALSDFVTAEDTHRKAIVHLPEMKNLYTKYLVSILRQHAALLDQMGRPSDAEKLRAEAAAF